MQAEGAFFHHALWAHPVAEVALLWIDFLFRNLRFGPVESAGVVGAGGFAVSAADTPVVIDHYDAVFFFPRGFNGTNVHARWVVALLALNRHVKFVSLRDGVVVVGRAVFHIHRSFTHFQHSDIGVARWSVVVVFFVTCLGATAATYADAEVERVAKFDTFLWADIFDGDIGTILVFGFLFETGDDGSQLVLS